MMTVRVVAAVIRKDDKIFATQRGYGEFKDGWEFPGGRRQGLEDETKSLDRAFNDIYKIKININNKNSELIPKK
jgi:8-oxo-dGTP diphosphatase